MSARSLQQGSLFRSSMENCVEGVVWTDVGNDFAGALLRLVFIRMVERLAVGRHAMFSDSPLWAPQCEASDICLCERRPVGGIRVACAHVPRRSQSNWRHAWLAQHCYQGGKGIASHAPPTNCPTRGGAVPRTHIHNVGVTSRDVILPLPLCQQVRNHGCTAECLQRADACPAEGGESSRPRI